MPDGISRFSRARKIEVVDPLPQGYFRERVYEAPQACQKYLYSGRRCSLPLENGIRKVNDVSLFRSPVNSGLMIGD